ncbi:hypothetical protein PQX77_015372 [Marasmius sp. AFHP31]|nr:hypothetical protein PQX77_015372 [Marasmius sp. AFHP31]
MGKKTGNPRGRQSWGRGKRLEVLEKHKALFLKDSSAYYSKVLEEFMERWGTLDVEIDPDSVDPATFVLVDTNSVEDLTERNEEIKRREMWKNKTRTKIRSWASHRWLKKAPEMQALNTLLHEVKGLSMSRPRRPQPFKYYQNKYWRSKLSVEFEDGRKAKGNTPGTNEKVSVDERNRFVQEKWDAETAEEKANIIAEIEAKYQEELEEYKTRCAWNGSALSYHDVWSNSESILSGITDAVGKLFGGGALLFVFGPRSTDGEVDIRSCTGVVPGSQVSKTDMFEFNPEAYTTATSMCVEFGKAVFSSEFCKSRIVSKEVLENVKANEDDDGDDEVSISAAVPEGQASETSESPSKSHQSVTTASSQYVPESSASTLPPPSSTAATAVTSSPPSSAPPVVLVQSPLSSPISIPVIPGVPDVKVNAVESCPGSTPSKLSELTDNPATEPTLSPPVFTTATPAISDTPSELSEVTDIPATEPALVRESNTLMQCTQQEVDNWWKAADVGRLFANTFDNSPNATPDETEKLRGHPYHQYRTAAANSILFDDGTFFNSNWNNNWGINSNTAAYAFGNDSYPGVAADWGMIPSQFMNMGPSNLQHNGMTAPRADGLHLVAPPSAMPLPSPTIPPACSQTALATSGAAIPPPSTGLPSPTPPSSDNTVIVATPTTTILGPDQACAPSVPANPSPLPPTNESFADSQPRIALTDRPDQTTQGVERPPSDGAENRPTMKRHDPPGDDVTAPPPKKRKPSVPADLSDTIAARKSTRTIIKPTRMGEESDHEELPVSRKARAAPKKKTTKGAKAGQV